MKLKKLYKKLEKATKKRSKQEPLFLKFLAALIFDVFDFTVGRVPAVGIVVDIIGAFFSLFLWGPLGLAAFLELLDPTEQIDGFIPTVTLIGILATTGKKVI